MDFSSESSTSSDNIALPIKMDQSSKIHQDSNNDVQELFAKLSTWMKEREESQRELSSIIITYERSVNKDMNDLVREYSDMQTKLSAMTKERDDLFATVQELSNENSICNLSKHFRLCIVPNGSN